MKYSLEPGANNNSIINSYLKIDFLIFYRNRGIEPFWKKIPRLLA